MAKLKTIHSKIFVSYVALLAALIVVFVSYFTVHTSKMLETNASQALLQLSLNMTSNLDSELAAMFNVSERIISSTPIKDVFFNQDPSSGKRLTGQRALTDLIYTITGPQSPYYAVNLFNDQGYFYEFGKYFAISEFPAAKMTAIPWVQDTFALKGAKFVSAPHADDWGERKEIVISVSRAFSNVFGSRPDSIVEVQQTYGIFEKIIEKSVRGTGKTIFVLNARGELIYPAFSPEDEKHAADLLEELDDRQASGTHIVQGAYRRNDVLAYSRSENTGWSAIVVESADSLLKPVYASRNNALGIGSVALLVSMFIAYIVSRKLTIPIKRMRKSIAMLDLHTLSNQQAAFAPQSELDELQRLNAAFAEMSLRLKDSLEETVSSRTLGIQSRLLALQSQMSPHFLYNALAVISAMSEENGDRNVVDFCRELTKMMRYISSESQAPVDLRQEMDHTVNYLNLMGKKYGDLLQYFVATNESGAGITVPKHIVQPIVENCFKHAFTQDPPWTIRIELKTAEGRWELSISDNGKGFEPSVLSELEEKWNRLDVRRGATALNLQGMGLSNIYLRLKLLYGEKAIFSVGNGAAGTGGFVTIGGPLGEWGEPE